VGEGTAAARAQVLAARQALDEELVRLEASARASADIPAKVRRNPVKAAGLAAGAGFVAVGGPQRLFRRAKRAIVGPQEPLPKAMLPDEIEKSLKRMGKDGEKVRGLLEREFATYLRTTEKKRKNSTLTGILTAMALAVGRPVLMRAARQVGEQLLNPESQAFQEQVDKVRARRAAAGIEEPPGGSASGAGL
jgi:hypothetical protein